MWLKSALLIFALALCFAVAAAESALRDEIVKPGFVEKQMNARSKQIGELIDIVKDSNCEMASRISSVQVLGGIRAVEAVDVLFEHLTIITPSKVKEKSAEIVAPCMPALVAIGKPSSGKALTALAREADAWRRFLLLTILYRVEGEKCARHLLQEAIRLADGAPEKANLEAALRDPDFRDNPTIEKQR